MTTTETDKLLPALLEAQRTFRPVVKDKIAKVESNRARYQYSYADLAGVMDACMVALHDNGIIFQQPIHTDIRIETIHQLQKGVWIETRQEVALVTVETHLIHAASGQCLVFNGFTINAGASSAQAIGSAVTYARRYQLMAVLGIAPEDDDGSASQQAYSQRSQVRTAPQVESQQSRSSQQRQQQQRPVAQQQQRTQQPAQQRQQQRPASQPAQRQQPVQQPVQQPAQQSVQQSVQQPVSHHPAETPEQVEPHPAVSVLSQLKQANCKTQEEQELVLNWLTHGTFTESPLKAIRFRDAAEEVLGRMRAEYRDGIRHVDWLPFAQAWREAEDAARQAG